MPQWYVVQLDTFPPAKSTITIAHSVVDLSLPRLLCVNRLPLEENTSRGAGERVANSRVDGLMAPTILNAT